MNRLSFWNRISRILEEHNLLRHPFYQAWRDGTLTIADLREYACEYYHHVAFFSVYLDTFAGRLPDGELKRRVLENLADEVGSSPGHPRAHNLLWMDFAIGVGAVPRHVFVRKPLPEVMALIQTFLSLAKSGTTSEVLAAFFVYESQVPAIAQEKATSLRTKYGLDATACRYFTLHATADVAHAAVWREELDRELEAEGGNFEAGLASAGRAAEDLWRALDGIHLQYSLRSR